MEIVMPTAFWWAALVGGGVVVALLIYAAVLEVIDWIRWQVKLIKWDGNGPIDADDLSDGK